MPVLQDSMATARSAAQSAAVCVVGQDPRCLELPPDLVPATGARAIWRTLECALMTNTNEDPCITGSAPRTSQKPDCFQMKTLSHMLPANLALTEVKESQTNFTKTKVASPHTC